MKPAPNPPILTADAELPTALVASQAKVVVKQVFVSLVFARILAAGGLWYRSWSHRDEMVQRCLGFTTWDYFVVTWLLFVVCFISALWRFWRRVPNLQTKLETGETSSESLLNYRRWVWFIIGLECLFYSVFYLLTLQPESDLFLLFLIPIVNGTILLDQTSAKRVWLVGVSFLAICISLMYVKLPFGEVQLLGLHSFEKFLLHIFPIRALSFYMASLPILLLVTQTRVLADKTKALQQANERFAQSESLYHSLVDTIPQCILRKDKQGMFTYASPRFLAFLGLKSEAEVIGKTDEAFFPEELSRKYREDDERVISGLLPIINTVERNCLRKSGESMTVRVVKVPVKNSSGEIVGIQAIFWDESDAQREKHKLLKWFLHDTPKPLTTIRDKFVNQLARVAEKLPAAEKSQILSLCGQITDVVDFTTASFHAHGYLGNPHKFEWKAYAHFPISEPIDLFFRILEPNNPEIHFKRHAAENVLIESDRNKVIAIVYLLAENAVKAVSKAKRDLPTIEISAKIKEHRLVIEVYDNGVGISKENIPHIFEENFSTFGGTGLGLAIVSGLAKLSGGGATVESEENVSAKFRVNIGNIKYTIKK